MPFCSKCGQKIDEDARFCTACGAPVLARNNTQRQQVFEGNIHKCPNCGEVVKAFSVRCPTCGHEFRGAQSSSSVEAFSRQILAIEATRKPVSKLSSIASAFGMSTSNGVDDKKENLIRNFAIPNTKEDIFEFIILAASNIDTSLFNIYNNSNMPAGERNDKLKVTKAWIAKFEQAYEKASLSFSTDPDFSRIENIYRTKSKEIKTGRRRGPIIIVALFIFLFAISVVPLSVLGIVESNKESKLNRTVEEIRIDIQNENYDDALLKANTLYFDSSWSKSKAEDWDKQREAIIKIIEEKKEANK